jgi:hypothetical protein
VRRGVSHENRRGITLVELLITILAGAIVIMGVYRLLTTSLWSYNLQEQLTDMYMNGTYTIKKLSEILMQAGANLPDRYYQVVLPNNSTTNDLTMRINKGNGKFWVDTSYTTGTTKIRVAPDSVANTFKGADSLLLDTGGWAASSKIDSVRTGFDPDTICLHTTLSPTIMNSIYAQSTTRLFLSGTNFCIDSSANVQAENIDSMSMTFRDSGYVPTTDWSRMVSVSLYVRTRTSAPDPKYKCPGFGDGYHRLALRMDVRFRNRF